MTKQRENKKLVQDPFVLRKTLAKPTMVDGEMLWPTKNYKGTYFYEDGPIYFFPAPKFEELPDDILKQLKD